MYDIIVLGATFAAAGIAHRHRKKCLILESSLQAGNEFYGALNFGSDENQCPKAPEALALQNAFSDCDPYSRITKIYPFLRMADILFGIRPISVEKVEGGYECRAYGVEGFCTFCAKQIIDTRADAEISVSKTYNLLIESAGKPHFDGVECVRAGADHHYILRLCVPLSQGYTQARNLAHQLVLQFSEGQKLIFSASSFDYQVPKNHSAYRGEIRLLPSKAYANPILAFEAGLEVTV